MKIAGSVALVTGGASGLGEATARALVNAGAKVAIFDMDQERGYALAQELGDSAKFFAIDITSEEAVASAIDSTVEAFGALHAAINCAGVATPGKIVGKKGPLPLDRFNKVVAINLSGTFNIMRLAAVKMMENAPNEDGEKGVVINTASVAAFEGQIGQAAYAASKAAVAGLTLPAAREFADYGIRVVCIAPGLFMTPMLMGLPEKAQQSLAEMMPLPKRLGYPSEYAALAMHIIENAMLNGETIRLDAALRMAAK
ncbi:MAG: SDR family NAD(P)-dependent oxidoreductase [Desulfatibacillaceae bacterium]|nr:SDR family NAD(P)-dependent oxidoreductase [Desulfatibacillaceae bacterium]